MSTPTPKDNPIEALPTQIFHPFPRLPLELRQQIWKLALPLTSEKPGVCILSGYLEFQADISNLTVNEYHSLLKAVSQEARQTALENLPVKRDYNPLIDILYIGRDCFFAFCSRATIDDWSRVRHIALSLPVAEMGLNMPFALFGLPGLEELSVVYPKSTGTVDLFDDVHLPETGPRKLRKLTETEMSSLVIKADFIYETHGGDVPIVWEKDVRTHLDFVMEELSRETSSGRPPCWDEESKRLELEMHALCFDVDGGR
ncbi:uncharacterized protein NECHADRAFT_81998 [Fusarium vanettenii 77-13-4]|uniref:2EXR domain-containing protein n=1 Tax=Fusarium vanettenii (strain ATCC MYA-4622 / CBS 123669 / FGSC 9596 / NRRL 45880 / 77-13-4) TaxID=660122 RepID=C7ZA72_FUSV7|nr:uncharacterized protein NECHADRAFT_81998 [Fusarium vanettenii 77-13-4]EEU39223.1 predicted protein [Fusarium vanettenii 77-13-4]